MNVLKNRCRIVFLFLVLFWTGCDSEGEDYPFSEQMFGEVEALVLNEGLFTSNTGAISMLYKDGTVIPDLFRDVNHRPIGDVAQSLTEINGKYFVALNNSKKIEVVDPTTFRSVGTICYTQAGFPRQIVSISPSEAIVSDLERQLVRIRTLPPYGAPLEYIPMERWIEYLVVAENKLFGMTSGGLYVFDLDKISKQQGRVIEEVKNEEVTKSCQLLIDYRGYIWALMHKEEKEKVVGISLLCVDPKTEKIVATHTLPFNFSKNPLIGDVVDAIQYNRTDMDSTRHWIYFSVKTYVGQNDIGEQLTQQTVVRMQVDTGKFELYRHLPSANMMYGFAVDPQGDVYLCDCLDYTAQRGYVRKYLADGTILNYRVGIYPNQIYFPKK